jgi:hypothetical protein
MYRFGAKSIDAVLKRTGLGFLGVVASQGGTLVAPTGSR